MHFNNYIDHRETRPFGAILLYSRWMACRLRISAPHLPERMIRQFGYTQTIPKHPVVSAPSTLTRGEINVMFDDHASHLVPKKAQSIIVESV